MWTGMTPTCQMGRTCCRRRQVLLLRQEGEKEEEEASEAAAAAAAVAAEAGVQGRRPPQGRRVRRPAAGGGAVAATRRRRQTVRERQMRMQRQARPVPPPRRCCRVAAVALAHTALRSKGLQAVGLAPPPPLPPTAAPALCCQTCTLWPWTHTTSLCCGGCGPESSSCTSQTWPSCARCVCVGGGGGGITLNQTRKETVALQGDTAAAYARCCTGRRGGRGLDGQAAGRRLHAVCAQVQTIMCTATLV